MHRVVYSIIGPGVDRKYGISAIDPREKHCAAAAPFLRDLREAERLVSYLNERQIPISEFCEAFVTGRLREIV